MTSLNIMPSCPVSMVEVSTKIPRSQTRSIYILKAEYFSNYQTLEAMFGLYIIKIEDKCKSD